MLKRPAVLAVFAALATAFAFAIAVVPSAQAATPVKIMALGDSITGSPGCWRALLWQRLQQNGITNTDFVGTLPPQGCGFTYDGENEGHGGFLVTNVADQNQLVGWLAATLPDIVMMHFGTNDVWSARTNDQILAAYSKLVDQMRASNPNMKILVAKIIPVAPSSCADCPARTVSLNNAIPGWAASKTTSQSPITVVDQWTGWNPATDTGDGVHPNDSGNVKMANGWYAPLAAAITGTTPPTGDTQAPTVPTNLASSVSCNPLGSTLTWTASTDNVGVTGYDIYRAPSSTGTFTQVGTSTTTSFASTGSNAFGSYEVRARDAAGNVSAFTAPITILPPPCPSPPSDTTPPSTPGTPTATITCGALTLNWAASTDNVGVTGYEVWRASGTSGGTFALVATVTTTSYAQSGVGSWRFQVRARDAAGNLSAFTSPVAVTTPACPTDIQAPTVPGTPVASGTTATQTTLTWTASTDNVGVTGYDIYRAPGASGGTFASVGTSTTNTFTNTGLTAGTTYRYQVRARDAAGNTSAFSAAVTVTTQTGGGTGGCSAAYKLINSWGGGFQGEVTVTNTGTTATSAWAVVVTFPSGQTITQIWSAKTTSTANPYTVTNETYNNVIQPSGTAVFGFLGGGNAATPTLTCTRTP